MTGRPDPLPGFREQLLAAGAGHHARRRHRQETVRRAGAGVAAVVVALAALAAFGWAGSGTASASVIVARDGNMWEVLVADDDATAAMVESALHREGVDAVVDAVPVGPSRVGQFISGDGTVEPAGGQLSAVTVRFPASQRRVHLLFGRPAGPGEGYVAASDAFGPGEPLECVDGVWRADVAAALARVRDRFDHVVVLDDRGEQVNGPPAGVVGDVIVSGPGRAFVHVHSGPVPDGTVTGSARCPLR